MKKITLLFSVFALGVWSVNAQYCNPLVEDCNDETITNVTFAGINNSTGCDLPYTDYTNQVAEVEPGETYEISVTTDSCCGGLNLNVFIDWDQDGNWDNATVYTLASVEPSGIATYSADITVPSDAPAGTTRMRVMSVYNTSAITPDPCEAPINFGIRYGEVEDYTVEVEQKLGIGDNTFAGFTFYPNPVAEVLNLNAKNTIDNVTLFNILGQKVFVESIGETTAQLNINSLEAGIYMMQVTSQGKTAVYRIVKK